MHLRSGVLWVACAISLMGQAVAAEAAAPAATELRRQKASTCARYSRRAADDGLYLALRNRCNEELRCGLSWRLHCEDDDDEQDARERSETLLVSADASSDMFASGADCGEEKRWRISDVRHSCEYSSD